MSYTCSVTLYGQSAVWRSGQKSTIPHHIHAQLAAFYAEAEGSELSESEGSRQSVKGSRGSTQLGEAENREHKAEAEGKGQ